MNHNVSLKYAPQLDGLRGAAILAVMAYHSGAPFCQGGFIGVDVFFVLSGFLITTSLMEEYQRNGSVILRNFYFRRILRLMPALLFLLIVFSLSSIIFLEKSATLYNLIDACMTLFYVSNWARAFGIHPPYYLGHSWALSLEAQFYILWPPLLFLILRNPKSNSYIFNIFIIASLAALSVWVIRFLLLTSGSLPRRIYNGLDTRMDSFLVGAILATVKSFLFRHRRLMLPLTVMAPLSAGGLVVLAFYARWRSYQMAFYLYSVVEICSAIVILDLLYNTKSLLRRVLCMKWLVWIGTLSYGLYLWHYPVYVAMWNLGFQWLGMITYGSLLTLFVATFSFYMLERRFLLLRDGFRK